MRSLGSDATRVADSAAETALPSDVLEVFCRLTSERFDAAKATAAQAQYREVAGVLFPSGAPHDWLATTDPSAVAFVEDGVLVFDPARIDVRRVDDDLRACMRLFHRYSVERGAEGAHLQMDLRALTWSKLTSLVARVQPAQMRMGMLLFSTLPCRVVEVVVYRPRAFGMGGVVRAVMAVTSSKIQQRTRLV